MFLLVERQCCKVMSPILITLYFILLTSAKIIFSYQAKQNFKPSFSLTHLECFHVLCPEQ